MKHYTPAYQIIRTEDFIKQTQALRKRYTRVNELIEGIDWALSRKPHFYQNIANDFYLWVTQELENSDIPQVKILYKIDEENYKVILIAIEEV